MFCRICLEVDRVDDLCCPCDCKGTSKWVHGRCQMHWMAVSGSRKCSVCNYDFAGGPMQEITLLESDIAWLGSCCRRLMSLLGLYIDGQWR
jgi:hypothetical protein